MNTTCSKTSLKSQVKIDMNYIEKKRNQIAENLFKSYSQDSIQAVSAAEFIEKGKKANLGEVREWGGQKVQKTTTGWVPYNENGGKTKEHKGEENKQSKVSMAKEVMEGLDHLGIDKEKFQSLKGKYGSLEKLHEAVGDALEGKGDLEKVGGSDSKISKEDENLKKLEEEVKGWDDEKLEEKAFKLRTFFKNTFGKIPSVDQLDPQDDKNEINLRKRLSIFSKEISRRAKN
jgi:hypothetical protein